MLPHFELDFTREAIGLLDRHLASLDQESHTSADPDTEGVFDRANYLAGLGFALLQTYQSHVISKAGLLGPEALSAPPLHHCGQPIALLVNAVANYWKHNAEWSRSEPSTRARKSLDAFSSLGVDPWGEYPIANALHALVAPHAHRFSSALPFIERWSEILRA